MVTSNSVLIIRLDRDNVAEVVVLKLLGGEVKNMKAEENTSEKSEKEQKQKLICIANTHLLFNPKRGDLKLAQIRLLLNSIDSIFAKHGEIPILLSGDLNLTPDSDIFKFLKSGTLDLYSINYKLASGQLNDFFLSDDWRPIESRIMSLLSKGAKQVPIFLVTF